MPKPLTDADVMTGFNPQGFTPTDDNARQDDVDATDDGPEGEGTEREDASAAPNEREVTFDGRTFKAPSDLVDAFTREINRRDGTRGAELQQLRERLARVEGSQSASQAANGEVKEAGPPIPDPELQIENPAEYQKQLLAYTEWQQEQKVGRLATQYEEAEAIKDRETARRAAWQSHVDAFYAKPENEVLRANKDIVDLVFQQHAAELAPLSIEEGFNRLSTLAKERLGKITGQAPDIKARQTPRPPTLEGGGSRSAASSGGAKEPQAPQSLSSALKARRLERAEAFRKGGVVPVQPARVA